MIFLVTYAFGCELWAPWSEEVGRWPVLQLSLFLVNIWQILAGLAPNFGSLLLARALGGLCSAGGSVTLGMIADLSVDLPAYWYCESRGKLTISSVDGIQTDSNMQSPLWCSHLSVAVYSVPSLALSARRS